MDVSWAVSRVGTAVFPLSSQSPDRPKLGDRRCLALPPPPTRRVGVTGGGRGTRFVRALSARQGSDSLWSVLERGSDSAERTLPTSSGTVAPPSVAAGETPEQRLLDSLTNPGDLLSGLVSQVKEVSSSLDWPSLGEQPGLLELRERLSGLAAAGDGSSSGMPARLQEVVSTVRDSLPRLEINADQELEALLSRVEDSLEAGGRGSSLLGQGVELIMAESGKLGAAEDTELVARLSSFGVPTPLTRVLAEALDFEFDLAEDGAPGVVALILVAVVLVAVFSSLTSNAGRRLVKKLPERYDPVASAEYFASRPALLLRRLAELTTRSAGFVLGVAVDRRTGQSQKNERQRATQCVQLLTELGPTFVKIGQALSIRVDLLSPEYVAALRTLQDRVPPFPCEVAKEILAEELTGGSLPALSEVLDGLEDQPVAAASLGQVYRCRLRKEGGMDVAIKVQRPNVREGIMLDLHLLRLVAPLAKRLNRLNSDLEGLVDEWGTRFVDELDYLREARNGAEFTEAMEARGITAVTAAEVVGGYTTPRVLTTRWVEGCRLEDSGEEDVSRLCGVALNAYLTMLLDTGTLHADPHPGNLLRTTEGRLCILDWGLVTGITRAQQYALVDYIANLVSEDYGAIPTDLVALGFVPPGKEALVAEAGVVTVLSSVLRQLSAGGGAAKINVEQLVGELQAMTSSYGNLFQIPPYFAYILRSFTVLEGIGLASDPNYAIVQECYPTLAQRLFVDPNPRTRSALRRIVLTEDGMLDAEAILRLTRSFQRFTASTQGLDQPTASTRTTEGETDTDSDATAVREALDRQLLSIILAEEPNYLQELLLEGAAKAVDALTRESVGRLLLSLSLSPLGAVLQRQASIATGALGPLRPILLPLPLPGELLSSWAPKLSPTEEDEAQLRLIRQLADAAQAEFAVTGGAAGAEAGPAAALELMSVAVERAAPLLPELAPGAAATWARFQALLVERAGERLDNPSLKQAAERLQAASLVRAEVVSSIGER